VNAHSREVSAAMSQGDQASGDPLEEQESPQQHLDREREASARLLRLAGSSNDLHSLMREATLLLREWSGCYAVGIRLREGDDFPYFETRGFPPTFLQVENSLCVRDLDGQLVRDLQGNVVLECMCGNVLCGRFNSALPFFTSSGSFWTNSTSELLAGTAEADRQGRTRNRCMGEGYESVALIPMRCGGTTFGLLQLNDPRPGRFTIEKITLFEELATALAKAMGHRQTAKELQDACQTLRESERWLREMAESLPQSVFEVDLEGRFKFVNRQALQMFGYARAEFEAGVNCFQLLAAHETERARHNVQRVLDGQDIGGIEYVAQRKDGSQFPVVVYSSAILRQDKPIGLRGVIIDVTERHRAEEAMRLRDRAINVSADGICITGANEAGNPLVYVNRGFELLTGYSAEDVLGRNMRLLQGPGTDQAVVRQMRAAIEAKQTFIAEVLNYRKDGKPFWNQLSITPVMDAAGQVNHFVAVLHDMSQHKATEQAIEAARQVAEASKARYEEVVAMIPEVIWRYEVDARMAFVSSYVSPVVDRLLGLPAGTIGNDFDKYLSYVHPEDFAIVEGPWVETLRTLAKEATVEYRLCKPDGTTVWVRSTGSAHTQPDGRIVVFGTTRDITEQKRAEEAVRESEQRYRSLFDNMLDGFAHCKMLYDDQDRPVDFVYLDVNSAFEQLTGLYDVVGKRVSEVFPGIAELQPELFEIYGRVALTGKAEGLECDFKPLAMWLQLSVYSSKKGHFVAVFHDISERKRAEAALRESEARFRSLIESAPEAIFVQIAARFVYLNPAACRLFGASRPEDLLGRELMERMAPEYRDAVRERILLQRETGKPVPLMEQECLLLDGSRVPVEVTAVSIWYRSEEAHLVFLRDITARKRAEEALRESREKYRLIVEMANEGIWFVDAEYRTTFVNCQVTDMLGYSEQEMLGHPMAEFLFENDLSDHQARMQKRALGTGEHYERRFRRKDGGEFWAAVSAKGISDADGRFVGAFGMFFDITSRKQDESRLTALETQLTHKSRLATLGELAAGVAHEVNQPLCAIVNFAKACKNAASQEVPDLPQIRQWSDAIATSAARSGDIIRQMLGFARSQSPVCQTIALAQLVDDAILLVSHEARTRNVTLRVELFDKDLTVSVDPVQIHQVLVNLLRNGIEAVADAGPADRQVAVQARLVDRLLQVSVSDNGSGWPAAELSKIFEPFFTTKPRGLGLGLAISRTIIEDQGGTIRATTNESGGLTVHFTLPAGKDNPQDVREQNGVRD
jgi:PAS domain S-box-containing protein